MEEKMPAENSLKDCEIIFDLEGVVENIANGTIHVMAVDSATQEVYNCGYEESMAEHEVGIGDTVRYTLYRETSGKVKDRLKFTPRPPLTEEDHKKMDEMFP